MGDMKFMCPRCAQSLVVDDSGAGEMVNCPHCGHAIEIPMRGRKVVDEIASLRHRIESLTGDLLAARQVFTETENETARTKALLTNTLQELKQTRAELSRTTAQLHGAIADEQVLRAELGHARTDFAVAEGARQPFEAECNALLETIE